MTWCKRISGWFQEIIPWKHCRAIVTLPDPEDENAKLAVPGYEKYYRIARRIRHAARGNDDGKLLDQSLKLFDNDAARQASIDSRAGSIMSAIGLAAALVTGVGFTTLKDPSTLTHDTFLMIVATLVVTLAYLTVTTVVVFQIQGRVIRKTPDPMDLVPAPPINPDAADLAPLDPRQFAARVVSYTADNYRVNEGVVQRLWGAQKCFRNGFLVLVAGGLVATGLQWWEGPLPASGATLAAALALKDGCTDLPTMSADPSGRWVGKCRHGGEISSVFVSKDGSVNIEP